MPTHLKRQIADSIRGMILSGELPAGARVKEEDLAQRYSVSRGPIRDVFIELSKEGFIEVKPNKGATVRDRPSTAARRILVRARRDLESLALKSGFPKWPKDALRDLDRILRQFRIAAEDKDLPEVIRFDMAFHQFIIDAYTLENLSSVWLPLVTTMALPYSRHADLIDSYKEHAAIVDALKEGDLKKATGLLVANIQ